MLPTLPEQWLEALAKYIYLLNILYLLIIQTDSDILVWHAVRIDTLKAEEERMDMLVMHKAIIYFTIGLTVSLSQKHGVIDRAHTWSILHK